MTAEIIKNIKGSKYILSASPAATPAKPGLCILTLWRQLNSLPWEARKKVNEYLENKGAQVDNKDSVERGIIESFEIVAANKSNCKAVIAKI